MTNQFSIVKYLEDHELVATKKNGDLKLTPSADGLSEYGFVCFSGGEDKATIVLCSLLHAISRCFPSWLQSDEVMFSLTEKTDLEYGSEWSIVMHYHDQPNRYFDHELVVEICRTMINHMAGSNISYLASQMIHDL